MSQGINEVYEVRPSAPESTIGALLTATYVQSIPLSAGTLCNYYGKAGEYVLIAAAHGKLTVSAYGQHTLVECGQALVQTIEGPYAIQSVPDSLCIVVMFRGELADRLLSDRMVDGKAVFPDGAATVREMALGLSVLEEEHSPVSGDSTSAYVYAMLVKLRTSPETFHHFSKLVESAIAIIQEDFPFLDGLDDLAERLKVSKAHLSRCFMQWTGISPGKYITRVRIQYAKLLLQDSHASISCVAEASGFANANYFAKVFRRETGMSPSEYLENVPNHETVNTKVNLQKGPPSLW